MARSTRPRGAAARGNAVTPAAQQVSVWEDDPELGIQITRPLPTRPSALSHITFLAERRRPAGSPEPRASDTGRLPRRCAAVPISGRHSCPRGIGRWERVCPCCSTKAST